MSIAQRNVQYELVKLVAHKLGSLVEQVVFLGGATVGLLLTEEGAPDVRETRDVDIIVEIINLADYYSFNKKLAALGFKQSAEVICRFTIDDIIVDCMPTDASILGFSNIWYGDAIKYANTLKLDNGMKIKVISAPYFIATKLEAFFDRGNNDFLASHDLEDIICVIDGANEIVKEVSDARPLKLRKYMVEKFSRLLDTKEFMESIVGHLASYPSDLQYARRDIVLNRIRDITNN